MRLENLHKLFKGLGQMEHLKLLFKKCQFQVDVPLKGPFPFLYLLYNGPYHFLHRYI